MPTVELTEADVEQYTRGRLAASDAETTRLLNAALGAVRRYCGWRVTPVGVDTVTLDGPGRRLLALPTLRLLELQSISEDGVALDLNTLYWSKAGLVRKKSGAGWSHQCGANWSHHYGSIAVTMRHGYDDAQDWQSAVLELIDRMSAQVGNVVGNSGPLVEKSVGQVLNRWASTANSMLNYDLIDPYRFEHSA